MRNSRSNIFFLSVLLIVVWVLVFFHFKKLKTPVIRGKLDSKKVHSVSPAFRRKKIDINRDPFSQVKEENIKAVSRKGPTLSVSSKKAVSGERKSFVNLKYSGYLLSMQQVFGFVNIDGIDLVLAEGEWSHDIKLVHVLKDSVLVETPDASFWIKRH